MIAKSFLIFFVLFTSELEARMNTNAFQRECQRRHNQDLPGYMYNSVSGNCYRFHREGKTWDRASESCKAEGANLAVADSELEVLILRIVYSLNQNNMITGDTDRNVAYIGVRDRLDGGSWKTVDGKSLAGTAFSWANGEPNNLNGNEHCGTFGRTGLLSDDSCDIELPYICETQRSTANHNAADDYWP